MWTGIVNQLAQSNQFQFHEDAETITINAKSSVINVLKQNIGSRVKTRELMQNFALKPSDDSASLEIECEAENIELKPLDQIQNKEVFNRLFKDALVEGMFNWDDQKSTNEMLFSNAKIVTSLQLNLHKIQVQTLQVLLASASLATLRMAFSERPMPDLVETNKPGPVAAMANKILGLLEEESKNANKKSLSLFFDCSRLLGLITCHNYTQQSESQITLFKQSLIDFLSVSLPESLAITYPDRKPLIAEPKNSQAIKVIHNFHLIIDCSESIGNLCPYFGQIASVVKEIGKISPEQTIHTTLFDNKIENLLPMRADSEGYLQNLLNQKSNFGGMTYLDGTILKVIEKIDIQSLMNEQYDSVLVFTDGIDNTSSNEEKLELRKRIMGFSNISNPTQFTFVQIGKKTDRAFFEGFSKATCATTIDLENPNNFNPLYKRVRELTAEKGDIREFLDQQNRVLATVRPTLGELTQLNLELPQEGFFYGRRGQLTKFNFMASINNRS